MEWLQLHLVAPRERVATIEEALLASGATAVTLGEHGAEPVLEPAPGETPLWPTVVLSALYDGTTAPEPLLERLRGLLGDGFPLECRWEVLADRAWEREWLQHFAPARFGERLWVCPDGSAPGAADAVVLRLDPGLAFGTGTHPTTALCLEWLDAHPPLGLAVVDYGCGSGILGIAALLLGAAAVRAIDIDPQALAATRANAARNAIGAARLAAGTPETLDTAVPADLLLANILAQPLIQLAPRFARLVRPGGTALLSGVLDAQADAVVAACAPWFRCAETVHREQWCRIALVRGDTAAPPAPG